MAGQVLCDPGGAGTAGTAREPERGASIVQPAPVPEAAVRTILARAGGNPFFLEELARMVVEQSNIDPTEGLPTTIESVLTARIDRLPPEAKHLLQVAAVIGKDSVVPLLQTIAEVPEAALQRGLTQLQTAELLYEMARGPTES